MDARAVEAGKMAGARFRYDLQSRTPNTLAAHALVRQAGTEGGVGLQDRVVEALFQAYFEGGQDIGQDLVLAAIAEGAGMHPGAIDRSQAQRSEIAAIERSLRAAGVASVPSHIVDQRLLATGSQTVQGYVRLLTGAANKAA